MREVAGTDEHERFLDATLPHLDAVWSVARRLAPSGSQPEDLVQETYLLAFRSFAGQDGQVRAWLLAICVNVARTEYRRGQRRPLERLGVDLRMTAGADDVQAEGIGRVERSLVAAALAELPEAQRVAIVLVDIGGLSAREAADTLGVPRGTVLARVHRGRQRLAAILRREGLSHGR